MNRPSRFAFDTGRIALVVLLFVLLPFAACNNSDSIGKLSGGGGGGTGGSGKVSTGGQVGRDAASDAFQCPLTNVYCQYGYVTDSYGCQVCAPAPTGTGGSGGGAGSGGVSSSGGAGGAGSGGTSSGGGAGGASGGAGSGGASGRGGASGASGGTSGTGTVGTGGQGGRDAASDAYECVLTDVYCPYGYILDAHGCEVCAPAPGGAGGRGGAGGVGGSTGAGGAGGAKDGGIDGGVTCGSVVCGADEYCCNASCSLCLPPSYGCLAVECGPDAGSSVDTTGCTARPERDSELCATTSAPHYYTCILVMLPEPCVMRSIGDVTNTFCCP